MPFLLRQNISFIGNADFTNVTFSGIADFSGATFNKNWDFKFGKLIQEGRLIFKNIKFLLTEKEKNYCKGDFHLIRITIGISLVFQDIPLNRVIFFGTDLRKVEFNNVIWGRCWGRNVVYDEILLHNVEQARQSYIRMQSPSLAKYQPRIFGAKEPERPS